MVRYRHYDPEQTKTIALSYARQLLPETLEHALNYLICRALQDDETGAPAY
ncbi:MAG: hypothetical protein ABIR10_04735 [Dokdonella sp.]